MRKLTRNQVLCYFMVLMVMAGSAGCDKSAESDRDAVTFPHTLFFGTDKGEVWNTNDGVNYRSFFTVDNSTVFDIISTLDAMYYQNGNVYTFKGPDDGNIGLPKGKYKGEAYPNLNNMLYCETEKRLYVPLAADSTLASTDDFGKTWTYYNKRDSFTNLLPTEPTPNAAVSVKEIPGQGIFAWTEDFELIFKNYNSNRLSKVNLSNADFTGGLFIDIASTSDKLIFFERYNALNAVKIQFVDPKTNNVIRSIDPPLVDVIYTIVPRDDNYLYLATSGGLYGLDINTLIFTPLGSSIPEGTEVYDVSTQSNTYRSGNVESYTYVATSEGLYLSRDYAKTFAKVYDGIIVSLSN